MRTSADILAQNELKMGGNIAKAEVFAKLAIADAMGNVADAIRELKNDFISIELVNDTLKIDAEGIEQVLREGLGQS